MTGYRLNDESACGHLIYYDCFVLNTNQFGCVRCKRSPEVIDEEVSI